MENKYMNRNNNKGITLLELLIAMAITTFIMIAGGGIYVSGMRMSANTVKGSDVQTALQKVMIHIEQNAKVSASNYKITNNGETVEFLVYDPVNPNFSAGPTIRRKYEFINNSIKYTPDTAQISSFEILADNVKKCFFARVVHDERMKVIVEATDKRNENFYALDLTVEAKMTSIPAVYPCS
jgi:type II secretory pathway pseudopilin PulG